MKMTPEQKALLVELYSNPKKISIKHVHYAFHYLQEKYGASVDKRISYETVRRFLANPQIKNFWYMRRNGFPEPRKS